MTCDRWVDAISALADGEDPGIDLRVLEAHLQRCPSCRGFRADVEASRGRLRVSEAVPQPDLSRRVAKLNAIADRAARWGVVRGLLAVVSIQIIVLSAPALLLGSEAGVTAHNARHLGAFSIAYAVGLMVVTVRPARARTMLPVAGVLGVALAVSGAIDMVDGSTGPLEELTHLPELLSVVLVWVLARPSPRTSTSPAAAQVLRSVDDERPGNQAAS
jgi:predicted anti-sigma-YlaC factor YlaD